MSAIDWSKINKVLIIRWGALGDLALCSAVFQDLYDQLPGTELHLNIDPAWSSLFENDPRFSKLVTLQMRGTGFFRVIKNWLSLLSREKYDLVIDLQSNDRSRLLLAVALFLFKAPRLRVSTRTVFPYNIKTGDTNTTMHAFELYREPLRALGLRLVQDQPVFNFSKKDEKEANNILQTQGLNKGKFIIFVPGSSISGALKRWGSHNYSSLGKLLLEKSNIDKICLLGGSVDHDVCEQIARSIGPSAVNLSGVTKLSHITTIVELSKAVVSNDTGLAHIAAASSVPVIVICGPTKAERVKPAGRNVRALQAPLECFSGQDAETCMNLVTPEMVFAEISSI